MTTLPPTAPLLTDRELPSPWAMCEGCGGPVPALAYPGERDPYCPACTRANLLRDAAGESLAALALPILGGWAHHWAGVGLNPRALYECVEHLAGAWMNPESQEAHLKAALRLAMQEHRPPTVTRSAPDRVTVTSSALPLILASALLPREAPAPGEPDRRRVFAVREPGVHVRQDMTLPAGADALLILGATPDAEALLYFTGLGGQTQPGAREGYRVPAAQLPAVREALGYWGSAEEVGA